MVGVRLNVVHWSPILGVGRGANNSTPSYEMSKEAATLIQEL